MKGAVVLVFRSLLLVTRTLPGLMKCSLPISQAYMVDISEGNAERSKHLVSTDCLGSAALFLHCKSRDADRDVRASAYGAVYGEPPSIAAFFLSFFLSISK